MASIGDLILRLLADGSQLEPAVVKEAQKAGDAGAKTLGQRLGASLKTNGVKAFGVAAAGAFAIASKGALQLQNLQADFQAQTGASADEAAAAAKTINRVAGEERTSLEAVSEAAILVRRDLGATGDEADELTSAFVRFARVTKQDAGGAVKDFDDILDAWGLTAADAVGIQDKLLVSQQKFGGSITENQKSLATLAPQLKALGATVDDGIGLLNLFAASGLDASKATFALNTAVKNLKPGQTLDDLIAQVSAIEDPTLRAQKAIELFGARGGVSLANVLRPGVDSLDAFGVSATDAAGATEKAADVIDNTFTGRIQKAISIAGANLRAFGSDFGPAATGAAALVSLLAPLGGGRLVKGILGPLADLGPAIAKRIGGSAAGPLVKAAWSKAGSVGATAYLKTLITGDAISAGLSSAVTKAGSSRIVTSALTGIGKVWGSTLGKATVLGAIAIIGVELWDQLQELNKKNEQQVKDIGTNVAKQITDGTIEELKTSRDALQKGISDLDPIVFFTGVGRKEQNELKRQLADVNNAILGQMTDLDKSAALADRHIGESMDNVASHYEQPRRAAVTLADGAKTSFGTVATEAQKMKDKIAANATLIKNTIHTLTERLLAEALAIITGYYDPLIAQDELRVQKDQVAADKVALAATKAGTAQRHQAQLTLDQSQKALDETRANLLASGTLTAKEQKDWLTDLQARYKSATGAAKTRIGELIAKIRELQNVDKTGVSIVVKASVGVHGKALGGPVEAGRPYIVGEDRPGGKGELFVPKVPGTIIPHTLTQALVGGAPAAAGGDSYTTIVQGLLPVKTITDIRREREHLQDVRRLRNGLGSRG